MHRGVRVVTPTGADERIVAPDLARGLMLLLIAVANVMIYLIDRPYGYRQHAVEDGVLNHVTSLLVVTVVDGRAFPLFALLFGYGIVQMMNRQRERGVEAGATRRIVRLRSIGLIILGAIHGIVLFPGDILGWYGIVGLVVLGLIARTDRALRFIAVAWLLPASIIVGMIYAQPIRGGERNFFWSFEISSWVDGIPMRAVEWVMSPFGLLPVLSAALVGVIAARHRILENAAAHSQLLTRTAIVGISLAIAGGLPSGLVVAGWLPIPGFGPGLALAVAHSLTGVAGGIGYAAVLGLLSTRVAATSFGMRAVTAAGRRSLSCYLFQSVVFVAVLSPVGAGWGARWGTAAAAGFAVVTWVLATTGAAVLDRMGVSGPAEKLLRQWSYRAAVKH